MSRRGKSKRGEQRSLFDGGMLPHLTKPHEAEGKIIKIPGSFWTYPTKEETAQWAEVGFPCIVHKFDALHKFAGGKVTPAFHVEPQAEDGAGDGGMVWVAYPTPFLKFYYDCHPIQSARVVVSPNPSSGQPIDVDMEGADGEARQGPDASSTPSQSVAEKPAIYQFLSPEPISVHYVSTGTNSGGKKHVFRCAVMLASGRECGETVSITCGSTSNAIAHFRRRQKQHCIPHAEALDEINARNPRVLQIDGEVINKFSFIESFPSHVEFVFMVASGIPANIRRNESFQGYCESLEPRVVMPCHQTIFRVAECIMELQDEHIIKDIRKLKRRFQVAGKSLSCLGLQLDMWTDTKTHISYGATTWSETECDQLGQLRIKKGILDFEQFPFTSHTAENIKTWFEALLLRSDIENWMVVGITPDGASDGQSALALTLLGHLVDTCYLHQLQRAILYALGLTGSPNLNLAAKFLIFKHRRVVQLDHQSRDVNDALRDMQTAAGVPPHKLWATITTCCTRWGNQSRQVSRNIGLKPGIDSAVMNYKQKNRGKAAFMEITEGETPVEVSANELGLTENQWSDSLELDAFLEDCWEVKEIIEKNTKLTGAQAYQMLDRLRSDPNGSVNTFHAPLSLKMVDRTRNHARVVPNDELCDAVRVAKQVLSEDLTERMFLTTPDSRPSESRLVQLFMSKQMPVESVLASPLIPTARALYIKWLHESAVVLRHDKEKARPSGNQARPPPPGKTSLFRAPAVPEDPVPVSDNAVAYEMQQWSELPRSVVDNFRDSQGILDEFALMSDQKSKFPIHCVVFERTAPHLASEADCETFFALTKGISDPNMFPSMLRALSKISANVKILKPGWEQILERYYEKFGRNAIVNEDDDE
jgi:hypothetical protein